MDIEKRVHEWMKQADYDVETAKAMVDTGRYVYCVFMSHLAVEKALKSVYVKRLGDQAPKTHSLVHLSQTAKISLSQTLKEFIENLDEVSIPTRYPEELDKVLKMYDKSRAELILEKTKEVIICLKQELTKP
jgi:HEPN domain-containing protein